MISADLIVAGAAQVATCGGPAPKRRKALNDVGLIEDGWIASSKGRIVFTGTENEFRDTVRPAAGAETIDARGLTALPGFVDCHTHLPFAGNRAREFKFRLEGWTYPQLAEAGMGILTTVRATRAASMGDLVGLCLRRLDRMLLSGTTTIEAKSGYGLDLADEIKQLEALKEADGRHPIDIVPTFMGAHEVPVEYRDRREEYIDLLINEMTPEIGRRKLAEFFDVFCEQGVFSVPETKRMVEAAIRAGFRIKIHADEFVEIGGARLAAEVGAVSTEHLINVSETGIAALAGSETAAVLLPGVSFFLMQDKCAPARQLVDAGAIIALATDYNPGSSMLDSMLFVMQLGVYKLHLKVEEALNACTANAAYAVGRSSDIGSIEAGKKADIVLYDVDDYISLFYELGSTKVRHVIKDGRVVVRDGCPAHRRA